MAISKYGNYIGKPTRGITRTQLTLRTELREVLDTYAKENNMKITHVIEELIEKYLIDNSIQTKGENK